jgi:hypothetical protein
MEKKTAGIILAGLGGVGLITAMIKFLMALNAVNINVDSSPDYTDFISAIAWGIPGTILMLVGLRIVKSEQTL